MMPVVRGLRRWPFLVLALAVVVASLGACASKSSVSPTPAASASGPDPTALVGQQAPDFSLVDQFGHPQRLSSYRGKVVLLTFASSHCTTVCPLTAEMLAQTQDLLGPAARGLQLVAVNTNPTFRSVGAVMRWSKLHAMTHRWLFLTGSVPALTSVWSDYGISPGNVHTTVVDVISASGLVETVAPIAAKKTLDAEAKALAKYVRQVQSS